MIQLRPYQIKGIHDIFDAWNPATQNLMNVLFQMPTGTGKTTVFSEIVHRARLKDKKILIVVHRKELVEQIVERLQQFGVQAGIISGSFQPDTTKAVQVATIQSLSNREYPLNKSNTIYHSLLSVCFQIPFILSVIVRNQWDIFS